MNMHYLHLLGIFIGRLKDGGKVSEKGLEAFDNCQNIDELINEVAIRIDMTRIDTPEADKSKAAMYILQTIS